MTEYLGAITIKAQISIYREKVETFTYLGSTLVEGGQLDAEVTDIVQS